MNRQRKDFFSVLLADDSEDDRFLLKNALRRTPSLQVVAEVSDGRETIAYLKGSGAYRNRDKFPLPDLVLLDLNMPVMDGFSVLEWLAKQSIKRALTVVVLTSSMQTEDIKKALDFGADLFQVKPRANNELETMVRALEEYMGKAVARSSLRHLPASVEVD